MSLPCTQRDQKCVFSVFITYLQSWLCKSGLSDWLVLYGVIGEWCHQSLSLSVCCRASERPEKATGSLSAASAGDAQPWLYASAESRIWGCAGKPGSAESHESMEDASDGTLPLRETRELISGCGENRQTQPDSLRHGSSTLEPAQVHFCLTSGLYRQPWSDLSFWDGRLWSVWMLWIFCSVIGPCVCRHHPKSRLWYSGVVNHLLRLSPTLNYDLIILHSSQFFLSSVLVGDSSRPRCD